MSRKRIDEANTNVSRRKNLLTELTTLEDRLSNIADNILTDEISDPVPDKTSSVYVHTKNLILEFITNTIKNELVNLIYAMGKLIGDNGLELADSHVRRASKIADLTDAYAKLKAKLIMKSISHHDSEKIAISLISELMDIYK